jgi:drug/metabolite transporter (DMT)-like permease
MIKHSMIVALGALSFGMLSSFAKIAYAQGYNAGEITFAQAALGALMLWGIVFFKKLRNTGYQIKVSWKLLAVGGCMGISVYTYYLALAYIPASLAIVLLMQMTWMSMLAEALLYRKMPSGIEMLTAVFILVGTIFAANMLNVKELNFSPTGIILGLVSAMLYSLFVLLTSNLDKNIPSFEKGAMVTTGSAIIIAVINLKSLTSSIHIDLGLFQWGSFLAIFGTVIPPICFNAGMPKIGPGLSSILLTLELPAAIFCAHLILSEEISVSQVFGIVVILVSIACLNIYKTKIQGVPAV